MQVKRLTTVLAVIVAAAVIAPAAFGGNYLVVYKNAVPADAAASIQKAGGALVYAYPEIGVAVASSNESSFRANVLKDSRVDDASATASFAYKLPAQPAADAAGPQPGDLPNAPASDADSLSPLQWDMRQIHTPEAHAITGGSPSVVVGDIDTGLDYSHPDLAQNVDFADSVSCLGGVPNSAPAAWDDQNGHGTHTAGTIAAASNGIGIVGVAPNVRIAGIRAGDADGFFFPEAVVCSFVWAGSHHIDVTNNSYFADPFLFNCHNDPTQQAIWKAEYRAIRYAETQGVTVVAAVGNESDDLSHPTQDVTSPDNTTPVTRPITNACVVIPAEIPGVITVSGDSNARQSNGGYLKSFYSSYGLGVVSVVAPGGDSVFGRTAESPNGRVLSTWPPNIPCTRSVKEPPSDPSEPTTVYCYLQGTSMASPHVAGVAALVISRYGSAATPQNGKMRPDQVAQFVEQTADPNPCPLATPPGYDTFVSVSNGAPQVCTGGTGNNSWYGHGQVNALRAITNDRSQSG